MMKPEDLRRIREQAARSPRQGARVQIIVDMGTSGIALGARAVRSAFLDEASKRGLRDVVVTQVGERGLASLEPIAQVRVQGEPPVAYGNLTAAKARRMVADHIVNGEPVSEDVIALCPEERPGRDPEPSPTVPKGKRKNR
jgi:NADP-reducing hydrogenase subunit HndB